MWRITIAAIAANIILAGCSVLPDWWGESAEKKLPGERYEVLPSRSSIGVDESMAEIPVVLPPVAVNTVWHHPNFAQRYHLALATPLSKEQEVDFGDAPERGQDRISATPVIAQDMLYLLDGTGEITARELGRPKNVLWSANISSGEKKDGFFGLGTGVQQDKFLGGNIAFGNDMLFATTVTGDIIAMEARLGREVWRRVLTVPIHSPPVAYGGVVYFITADNHFYALEAASGKTLWTHAGITELTGVLGAPIPVVEENMVIVPYSSGEIYALRRENGAQAWGDSLAALKLQNTSLFSLNDIDATPVVYDGTVYAVGHEGLLSAIELATGRVIWEREISSLSAPWIAGEFLFLLTSNDELLCIYRPDGRVKWITPLPSYENPQDFQGRITWNGPVVAGNRVIAVSSNGGLWELSPENGSIVNRYETEKEIYLPPVVAGTKLYLVTNDATLLIWQ